jgi:hypothetical protein
MISRHKDYSDSEHLLIKKKKSDSEHLKHILTVKNQYVFRAVEMVMLLIKKKIKILVMLSIEIGKSLLVILAYMMCVMKLQLGVGRLRV